MVVNDAEIILVLNSSLKNIEKRSCAVRNRYLSCPIPAVVIAQSMDWSRLPAPVSIAVIHIAAAMGVKLVDQSKVDVLALEAVGICGHGFRNSLRSGFWTIR
jgi:hypothetical protein